MLVFPELETTEQVNDIEAMVAPIEKYFKERESKVITHAF